MTCPFFTLASSVFPAYITQTPPATLLSPGIATVSKPHGFSVTGAGLEMCTLTPMVADPRQPYKPGMPVLPLPGAQ